MREIVFDTETTGLDPIQGDRLVEIGCIELINRFPSGRTFHCYFNPERDMPEPAFKVHGLSVEFLKDKPLFAHKVEEVHQLKPGQFVWADSQAFNFPAARTGSTTSARATGSTIPSGSSTALCSTPSSWPRSMSS